MRQFRNVPRNCSYAVLQRLDEAASCRRVAKLLIKGVGIASMVTGVENDAAAVATSGLSLYGLHERSTSAPTLPLRANDEGDQTAIEIVVFDEAADMHRGQARDAVVDLGYEDRRPFARESLKPLGHLRASRRVAKLRKKRTDLGRVSVHELTDRNGGLAADRSIICFSGFPDDGTPTCASVREWPPRTAGSLVG